MHDDVDIGALCHILKVADGRLARSTEAQPVMRRHQQNGIGSDRLGCQRLRDRLIAALGADAGHHFDLVPDFVSDDLGDARPLVIAQRHDLAGMPIAYQTRDAINRCQILHIIAQADLVDGVVIVEGAECRRQYASPGFFKHAYAFPKIVILIWKH